MECNGQVSIWLGNFNDLSDLEMYVQTKYTDDGDSIDSKFETDFKIDYFDEDFREINVLEESQNSFSCILEDHSYYKSIIANYTDHHSDLLDKHYNSIILLYDFKYTENVKEIEEENMYIKFIGNIEYDETEID
jgi:hypothetical protein